MKELCNSGTTEDSDLMHYVTKVLDAFIDSGSQVTLLRKSVFDELNVSELQPSDFSLSGFVKGAVKPLGYLRKRSN
ncbi:hypothetical protein TNCT_131911 [Trichonephila clavata]|uniref:Uncharacterized protein n=1 Tax=Trichonephila clavata TaxID=2740835 RepID=A0A8X6GNP6_TRICU|nr:hypothetical protein TNCT_131911 [Trichonephila clavata]